MPITSEIKEQIITKLSASDGYIDSKPAAFPDACKCVREIVEIMYPKLSSQTIHKIMKVEGRLATNKREYSIMGNVVAEMYYVDIPSGWKIEIKIHLPGGEHVTT